MQFRNNSLVIALLLLMFLLSCQSSSPTANRGEFTDIFDGRTLTGWEGDSVYWRVENGHLVGEVTPATLLQRNSFLIWRGGLTKDFELKVEYRISAKGNSGINYRSEEVKDVPFALKGYQADLDGAMIYTGSNYEERGRTTLASRGRRVELSTVNEQYKEGNLASFIKDNFWTKVQSSELLADPNMLATKIKQNDWNEYHLIINGNRLQHYVNGVLMTEVIDNDSLNRRSEGLLGVQVHVGPPMKVEFRSIQLKAF